MSRRFLAWVPRAGACAAIVTALSLTAYVGSTLAPRPAPAAAALPRATTGAPTRTPVPTLEPIPRDKPVAIVAGNPISGADYADLVVQQLRAAAIQAQQQGGAAPNERQIRAQALT